MGEHVFWITSRAAGITALLASSLAVALGLMMSTRLRTRLGDMRVWHESLSLATMVALAVHAFSLLGDSYIHFSLADVTIPFASSYERVWMGLGIAAGWAFVILGLSYYLRGRIGPQRWRRRPRRHPRRRAARAPPDPDEPGARMSHRTFSCFGARCGVWATGEAADDAVADARDRLLSWHTRFTRFDPTSELSRLNADPRDVVPASTAMTRLIDAVREAARATGGLVDGTLLGEIEAAGYVRDIAAPLPLELALRLAPARRPAAPNRTRAGATCPSRGGRSPARPASASASTAAGAPRACSRT